jgi:hypothetical protein
MTNIDEILVRLWRDRRPTEKPSQVVIDYAKRELCEATINYSTTAPDTNALGVFEIYRIFGRASKFVGYVRGAGCKSVQWPKGDLSDINEESEEKS